MEVNMDLRSALNESLLGTPRHLGVRWAASNGKSGWFHVWSDGVLTPYLSGGSNVDPDPDAPDPDDPDPDDPDPDDPDPDDDDDDDDDGLEKLKVKNPAAYKHAKEAAKHRLQRNKAREDRDSARTERDELKTKVADLEAKLAEGVDDKEGKKALETANGKITSLEAEVSDLKKKLSDTQGTLNAHSVERQVSDVRSELKVKEDAEFIVYLLDRNDLLEVDEDGEVEDLERHVKRLIKKGKLNVVSDDGDDDDDEEDKPPSGNGSSGRSFQRRNKGGKGQLDRAALEAKYPALRR